MTDIDFTDPDPRDRPRGRNAVGFTVIELVGFGVARALHLDSLDDFVVQLDREVNYVIVARNPFLQEGSWLDVQRNCRDLAKMVAYAAKEAFDRS